MRASSTCASTATFEKRAIFSFVACDNATGKCITAVAQGAACTTGGSQCGLGLFCQGGTCQTPPVDGGSGMDSGTGVLPVGSACNANGQCTAGTCATTGFPNGYCTVVCTSICPNARFC